MATAPRVTASWNGTVLAECDDTVVVEGNHCLARSAVRDGVLVDSARASVCPWKGTAGYHDVVAGGRVNTDAAWYYADPKPAAAEIRDRVAFWKGVEVVVDEQVRSAAAPPAPGSPAG